MEPKRKSSQAKVLKLKNDTGTKTETVVITPPKMRIAKLTIRGTAPLVQSRFTGDQIEAIRSKHEQGSTTGKNLPRRQARDFQSEFLTSMYRNEKGRYGINAAGVRNGAIGMCRLCNFKMTHAKLSIFVMHDFIDPRDGTPLVEILSPDLKPASDPEMIINHVKNDKGETQLRTRAMWSEWAMRLRIRFDADQFSTTDLFNLMWRLGIQGGFGEGRPNSKKSAGRGWGTFSVDTKFEVVAPEQEGLT